MSLNYCEIYSLVPNRIWNCRGEGGRGLQNPQKVNQWRGDVYSHERVTGFGIWEQIREIKRQIKLYSVWCINIYRIFFNLFFFTQTFTIHRTVGEGRIYLFNSSLTFSPAAQALCRAITVGRSPLHIASSWSASC